MSVHKGRYLLCQVLQVSVIPITPIITSDHRGTRETSKILMEYGVSIRVDIYSARCCRCL